MKEHDAMMIAAFILFMLTVTAVAYLLYSSQWRPSWLKPKHQSSYRAATPQEEQFIDDALGIVTVSFRLDKHDRDAIMKLAKHDGLAYVAKLRQLVLTSLLTELEQKKLGVPVGLRPRLQELTQSEQEQRENGHTCPKRSHT